MAGNGIESAAQALVAVRKGGERLENLPAQPATVAEAHAVQDRVTALLGEPVGAFKANAPPNDQPTRGIIYARDIHPNPARLSPDRVPDLGVEGEIAFRFTRDLPPKGNDYTRAEVSAALEACPAIEVVSSRFRDQASRSALEKLADCISNGAFVPGAIRRDWQGLDLPRLHVTLTVNGEPVVDQTGGHPSGDPLGVAVALVNMMRLSGGVRAGQYVTTGSCTGLRFLRPGDVCQVRFEGLGEAEVRFG
jgi:2-keto-4-pentenoate hydratase